MRRGLFPLGLLVIAACAGSSGSSLGNVPPPTVESSVPAAAVTAGSSTDSSLPPSTPVQAMSPVALADANGDIGVVQSSGVERLREGWQSTVSLDGTYAVSTVDVNDGDTKIAWDALPTGEVMGGTLVEDTELVTAATQVGGTLAAFVNPASDGGDDAIAGGREATTIVLASLESGVGTRFDLPGNYVPEAFGRTLGADGLPAQMFVLEYTPAESPTVYRVRVLDIATGELSLPINLRDKIGPPVDQEMAGVSRDQVLSSESGLLFTLYRGTSDMPDGHPYAFVHTLDLYDGVWCLDLDPALELEHLPGSLATFGNRLYVASANGLVGSFDIDAIVNPQRPAEMEWVTRLVDAGGESAPALAAGPDGLVAAWGWMSGLHSVAPDGTLGESWVHPPGTEALTLVDGEPLAIGSDWWDLGEIERPDWLRSVTRVLAG